MHLITSIPFFVAVLFAGAAAAANPSSNPPFDPRTYPKSSAQCNAVDRGGPTPVNTTITLEYVDVNPTGKNTLLLLHGWPSLWSSWSNQIQEFGKDYRLIVPDLRGFGSSTDTSDVQTSGMMQDIVSDAMCILDKAGVKTAPCVGHDWGAVACWTAGLLEPTRFTAIAALDIPYQPAVGNYTPPEDLVPLLPKFAYQVYFEKETSTAAQELDKDIRRTLRATLRTVASPPPDAFLTSETDFLGAYNGTDIPPIPFFSQEEEDYFVEQYSIQRFEHTLQFYTNASRYGTFEYAKNFGNPNITVPALSILPTEDPVANWSSLAEYLGSANYIANLKTVEIAAAHWVQLEKPAEVNQALREWLTSL
ncbi:hypothetical protein BOTBODRAFT_135565 [Botryobasidium botryosum FD-172 SS1]|uniref:AB hydrolase-1 domain-containing protein n=1 Tax=Botryobasidium botryosum (strain FD-172 SS1) TaxID=930990 RepID=A0A067M7I0_BOTB1|nr:hypothetical protein BOTBODRAFT_135565 [Botryobasidium botryosum FD-172 SS1]